MFAAKPNLRLLSIDALPDPVTAGHDIKWLPGGFLAQDRDIGTVAADGAPGRDRAGADRGGAGRPRCSPGRWSSTSSPTPSCWRATAPRSASAWARPAASTRSQLAVRRAAEHAGSRPCVVASDAFFPFADGLVAAIEAGATAAIQPGRQRARSGGDRRRRRGRHRHGVHRHPPLPPLRPDMRRILAAATLPCSGRLLLAVEIRQCRAVAARSATARRSSTAPTPPSSSTSSTPPAPRARWRSSCRSSTIPARARSCWPPPRIEGMITSPTQFSLPVPLDKVDQGHDYRAQGRDHRPGPAGDGDRQPAAGPDQGPADPGRTCVVGPDRRPWTARAREADAWRPMHRGFVIRASSTEHIRTPWRSTIRAASTASAAGSSTSSATTARIYDADTRHLVSSTRFVFNYAMAVRRFGDPAYLGGRPPRRRLPARGPSQPGDRRLCLARWAPATRSWTAPTTATGWPSSCWPTPRRWKPASRRPRPSRGNLAADGAAFLVEAGRALPRRDQRRLADVSPYRGQNANMHSCEAMLAAFEATGEAKYLDRADAARRARHDRPRRPQADGLVWEHYDAELVGRLGLQQGRPQAPVPALGLPARPSDRVDQAAADPGAPSPAPAWLLPTAHATCSTPRCERAWDAEHRRHLLRLRPGRHRSATATSISGSRPRASPPPRCWRARTGDEPTGTGTTGSGTIPGRTWSTTTTAPGIGSSTSRTASTTTRRARPARPTTTRWAPATRC